MIRSISLAVMLLTLIVATATSAGAQGKGKAAKPEARESGNSTPNVTVVFRDSDQAIFRDYLRTHRIVGKPLPPGIAKNVARGKPLPPGIAKQALPPELVGIVMRNTAVPRDTTFAIVGDMVVATRRGVVVDVMTGLFR